MTPDHDGDTRGLRQILGIQRGARPMALTRAPLVRRSRVGLRPEQRGVRHHSERP